MTHCTQHYRPDRGKRTFPRVVFLIFTLTITASYIATARAQDLDAQQRFLALLDESWETKLREDPVFATTTGDGRYNHLLADESLEGHLRRQATAEEHLERLRAIPRGELLPAQQTDYDIFELSLQDYLKECEFESYLIPITNRWGFHIAFPQLPEKIPLKTVKDYENYIARLRAFSTLTDQTISLMQAGIAKNLVLPAVVLDGHESTIEAHIVTDPTTSLFYRPALKFPSRISEEEQQRLAADIRAAIQESVSPAYQRFLTFMADTYVPSCRGSIGASALPNGREYYRHRVRHFTTLKLSPEEVHEIGLAEVARIRLEMLEIIKRVEFDGDFAAFVEFLRTDPRFYVDEPHDLLAQTSYILKKMDGELPRLFKTLPRTPYGLVPVPDYIAPKTTAAYYQRPAGDGSRAGFYNLNTYNLKSRPTYGLEALALHEAVPGHHLQIALQQELELANFRRFSSFTVFIEGWALYAERLGLEVGFYEDPYSDFGRLTYEMWRACRLVVDTGIHYLGWSREQAIEFLQTNSALSMHNIQAEVDRYIAWPGQALAYKMGELKIRELRGRAEKQLGDKFDIREFHDVVLGSGSVPLAVLEKNVTNYISRVESATRP